MAEATATLRGELVPLSVIKDKESLAHKALNNAPKENQEPLTALAAALELLSVLYKLDDPRWLRIRDRVLIGLIKETKDYGNTSVSMGAAKAVDKFETCVGFLNCGTGGIKYQMYSTEGGYLHLAKEVKQKNGASPGALEAGQYRPKTAATLEATRKLLETELESAPWKGQPNTPVYAFVTGTIRQHWEEGDAKEKKELEGVMEQLFHGTGIRPLSSSYFMSQDEEGRLELLGSQEMYNNLAKAGQLDPGTSVVGSLGIGRGSCQWMIMRPNGQTELIAHRAGMTDLHNLAQLPQTVMSEYKNDTRRNVFLEAMESSPNPVIALKSGAMLTLENKDYRELRDDIKKPVPVPAPPVVVAPKPKRGSWLWRFF